MQGKFLQLITAYTLLSAFIYIFIWGVAYVRENRISVLSNKSTLVHLIPAKTNYTKTVIVFDPSFTQNSSSIRRYTNLAFYGFEVLLIKSEIQNDPDTFIQFRDHIKSRPCILLLPTRHSASLFLSNPCLAETLNISKTITLETLNHADFVSIRHICATLVEFEVADFKKRFHPSIWLDSMLIKLCIENALGNGVPSTPKNFDNEITRLDCLFTGVAALFSIIASVCLYFQYFHKQKRLLVLTAMFASICIFLSVLFFVFKLSPHYSVNARLFITLLNDSEKSSFAKYSTKYSGKKFSTSIMYNFVIANSNSACDQEKLHPIISPLFHKWYHRLLSVTTDPDTLAELTLQHLRLRLYISSEENHHRYNDALESLRLGAACDQTLRELFTYAWASMNVPITVDNNIDLAYFQLTTARQR